MFLFFSGGYTNEEKETPILPVSVHETVPFGEGFVLPGNRTKEDCASRIDGLGEHIVLPGLILNDDARS